jgi:hypothetical protein
VSDGSDGPQTGPVGERAGRSAKPPVPRAMPSDPAAPGPAPDGRHRTERVPFPLPPLPPHGLPEPAPGSETGRLHLGGYPPKVPGGSRPGAAPADGTEDVSEDTGGDPDGR